VKAELHADAGAAAACPEFFRSREFAAAEGVTHTLEAGPVRLPVIAREIPGSGGLHDATSPYGYPGGTLTEAEPPPAPADVDWSAAGLVSLFVRDRIGEPPAFTGGTERSVVQVHDPSRERAVRPRMAEQVRQNERAGWAVSAAPGPDSDASARASFHALYTQTMERTEASERYFFEPSYFDAVLTFERSWLLLAGTSDLPAVAGAIAALSDGVLHYYLGGTADAALEASPFKNVVSAMLDLAGELGAPLNLGGGLSAGDGLERFKRGFANGELPFVTHEIVCDPEAYERLSGARGTGRFFPAYRAPLT